MGWIAATSTPRAVAPAAMWSRQPVFAAAAKRTLRCGGLVARGGSPLAEPGAGRDGDSAGRRDGWLFCGVPCSRDERRGARANARAQGTGPLGASSSRAARPTRPPGFRTGRHDSLADPRPAGA